MLRRQVLKSAVAAAFAGGIASQVVASVPVVSSDAISLHWSNKSPEVHENGIVHEDLKLDGELFADFKNWNNCVNPDGMWFTTLTARSANGQIVGFCVVWDGDDCLEVLVRSISRAVAESMLDECLRKTLMRANQTRMLIFDRRTPSHDAAIFVDHTARWIASRRRERWWSVVRYDKVVQSIGFTLSESQCNPTPTQVKAIRVSMEDAIDDFKAGRIFNCIRKVV